MSETTTQKPILYQQLNKRKCYNKLLGVKQPLSGGFALLKEPTKVGQRRQSSGLR